MAIRGFRDTSGGSWYQIHPVPANEGDAIASVTDISIQNLNSDYNIYVASSNDWDTVGMLIKPNQIVAFEGLTVNMQLWVNDDGDNCEMAVMKIER